VRKLQRELRSAGEHPGPVDGRFGPLTERAVRDFQDREGLGVDGIVGKATHTALVRRLTSVRTPRSGTHSRQAEEGKPKPAGRSGQPKASTPVGQPREAPVGTGGSDDSGLGTTTAIALALAAALALLSAILALTLRKRRSEGGPQFGHPPIAGSEPTEPARAREDTAASKGPGIEAVPVLGYASIDASPGSPSNREFQAQAEKIAAECDRRGLVLLELVREREPHHGAGAERPGLGYALERISAGDAQGLVVADLSRLGRSVVELGRVLEWFSSSGARLVGIAQGLDTREREGSAMARTLIEVSSWERERLIERTRRGMRAARRKGPPAVGDNPELKERISRMRDQGMTLQAIADMLNGEGVPTVRGGALWRPSSVQASAGYRRPRAGDRLGASWSRNGERGNGGL
jgi:DNA invertase Pin-like site-specific DNA recombinase